MAPRFLAGALSAALVAAGLVGAAPPAAAQQTIGYPTFTGPADPVPPEPADYTVNGMMRAMYEAEKDGTDFWMDRLLAREGADPAGNQLMTRGRALYMYSHNPSVIGFGGDAAYWDNIDGRGAYTISLGQGGYAQDVGSRRQTPSHWRQTYTNPDAGFAVEVTKFITHNNVAVTNLAITNTTDQAQTLPIRVSSPYATVPDGDELTGIVDARFGLTVLFPRLSGTGLSVNGSQLAGSITVGPGETRQTKVTMGFVTEEITESLPEYERYRDLSPGGAFATHVRTYNKWWADNLPYIDVPDEAIKKFIYYRWWVMRYNFLDADIPGNDFQFPVGIEGVTGYNNSIALTVPMIIDELKYLRDPMYAYGTMLSAGEGSRNSRYQDNPGKPTNWNDSYLQYTTDAAWRAYQIHGGQPRIMQNLAHYGEMDVKSQLEHFKPPSDVPGANPYLLWYCCGYLNGNDADNTSFAWFNRGSERTETAYVYANALATAEAYDLLGNTEKAAEMRQIAANVRDAILDVLWDDESRLFLHRDVHTDTLIPWKEINNYYPFTVGLVPNEEPYLNALRLFDDPAEYPIFPFYTANQKDKAAAADGGVGGRPPRPGSNNFSQINSTVQFRLLSSVLRNYDTEHLDEEWYKKLLYWNAWAHYIDGNTAWPDSNEFWFNWDPEEQTFGRSFIHHSVLGSNIWTVIEDAMGLRPRTDDKVELWPIDIAWDHFTVTDINYRGRDLTIVWDDPTDGTAHYPGVPEGYSVFIDGERAFTVDRLTHLVWDPDTGAIDFPDETATVIHSAPRPDLPAPHEAALAGERVVDIFQKAGLDISSAESRSRPGRANREPPNLALGATPDASFIDPATDTDAYPATDLDGAVDGFTINMPFWGSAGSGNAQDWYELDFGEPTTFTEVKLYFFNDRQIMGVPDQHRVTTTSNRYREPAMYTIQVWRDATGWVDVRDQLKSPTYPRSNYNRVAFRPVTAQRMRVLMTHRDGYGTGLKEVQVFRTIEPPPRRPPNQPPHVVARQDPTFSGSGQVRLEGIVEDDGLPSGTLDTRWRAVSGPGLALLDDSSANRPMALFSEGGEYVFEVTASDGALRTRERVTVAVPDIPAAPNVATEATPSCSYTSPWESCATINSGVDPPSSNPPSSQYPRWGTWPEAGEHWIQVTWDAPTRVSASDIYWFQDSADGSDSGVKRPAQWTIQYWDGQSWQEVSNPSGYGTALNQYNHTTFDAVVTTRLRANVETRSDAQGVGALEWKVYGDPPAGIRPLHIPTLRGELPDLPETVTHIFSDGRRSAAPVVWQKVTPDQVETPGTSLVVPGLSPGVPLIAQATVHVRAGGDVAVTSLEDEELVTLVGVAPELPPTVTATFDDGSKDNVSTFVTWDEVDPASYSEPGEFTVTGQVANTDLRARAHVTVVSRAG